MFFALSCLVVFPAKITTNGGLTKIFKNLWFKKEEIGRGAREYGVNTS
jgi:hypothetical protein